jgi:hypothetical protein
MYFWVRLVQLYFRLERNMLSKTHADGLVLTLVLVNSPKVSYEHWGFIDLSPNLA